MYAMFQRWSRPGTVVAAVIGVLVLTGCQANGGGTLTSPDASCARPVSFGFVFSVPTFGADGTFAGSFHDPCAVVGSINGVSFNGAGAMTQRTAPPQAPQLFGGCMVGLPSYESSDPANPGSGVLSLIVCDSANAFGQTAGAARGNVQNTDGDFVDIQVMSGPYATYRFTGTVAHGNVTLRQ